MIPDQKMYGQVSNLPLPPQPPCVPPKRPRGRPRIHPPRDPNAPRRPRGRPRGSVGAGFKPAHAPASIPRLPHPPAAPVETPSHSGVSTPHPPRRRGRPPGSRNKCPAVNCKGGFQTRPSRPRPAPSITIGDHHVPWSFIKYTYKRLGCDWDSTIDAFWKCRNVTGSNAVQRYIMAGFKPTKYGIPILTPSHERENGQMENIREWWIQLYRRTGKKSGNSCTDARPCVPTPDITSMIEQLSQGMSF